MRARDNNAVCHDAVSRAHSAFSTVTRFVSGRSSRDFWEMLTWQDSTVSKSHQCRGGTDELSGWWINPRDRIKRGKEAFGSVLGLNSGHVVVV